jgi:hypothetical protein
MKDRENMLKQPLESRVFKYKNKSRNFFCPLCRTERNVNASAKLTKKNYAQIFLTSVVLGSMLYPFFKVESFVVFFAIWGAFELAIRSDFKKQVACPHCGFDATWYKKDVKVARQKVAEFWAQKQQVNSSISDTRP